MNDKIDENFSRIFKNTKDKDMKLKMNEITENKLYYWFYKN